MLGAEKLPPETRACSGSEPVTCLKRNSSLWAGLKFSGACLRFTVRPDGSPGSVCKRGKEMRVSLWTRKWPERPKSQREELRTPEPRRSLSSENLKLPGSTAPKTYFLFGVSFAPCYQGNIQSSAGQVIFQSQGSSKQKSWSVHPDWPSPSHAPSQPSHSPCLYEPCRNSSNQAI